MIDSVKPTNPPEKLESKVTPTKPDKTTEVKAKEPCVKEPVKSDSHPKEEAPAKPEISEPTKQDSTTKSSQSETKLSAAVSSNETPVGPVKETQSSSPTLPAEPVKVETTEAPVKQETIPAKAADTATISPQSSNTAPSAAPIESTSQTTTSPTASAAPAARAQRRVPPGGHCSQLW